MDKKIKHKTKSTIFYDKDYESSKLKVANNLDKEGELKIRITDLGIKGATFFLNKDNIYALIELLENAE
jgi:hypothetical protein